MGAGGETAVRVREGNGIVWEWHCVLVGAGGERAVRGTERNGIIWDCY